MRGFARWCVGVYSGARARMHKSSAQNVCTVKFREGCRTSNSQREQGPTSTGTGVVYRNVSVGDTTVRPYRYTATAPSYAGCVIDLLVAS